MTSFKRPPLKKIYHNVFFLWFFKTNWSSLKFCFWESYYYLLIWTTDWNGGLNIVLLLLHSFYRPSRWWRATLPRSTRPEWRLAGLPTIITTTVHSPEELTVEEQINHPFCLLPSKWPHYDSRCYYYAGLFHFILIYLFHFVL